MFVALQRLLQNEIYMMVNPLDKILNTHRQVEDRERSIADSCAPVFHLIITSVIAIISFLFQSSHSTRREHMQKDLVLK